nr:immunoglobulin heavy chain junction region [Macaca mulatta]MOW93291.1 immunoglobulin heavy chain junction region [Macaca mulatta]MOW93301.1 immunoglobulin heavy chain junction region [Macaca mulatta]MOW93305.1 immunoglobulin heavy chain junction region [Macaca mulatta]MOW93332.1 immunoglobulin heavy chain junction region [Macaca mulatta]
CATHRPYYEDDSGYHFTRSFFFDFW